MANPNLTTAELDRLINTKNEEDWNEACDAIKAARGNKYPDDWFAKMLQSGLMHNITESWKVK